MGGEWKETNLEELTEVISDCPHSTPKWTDTGVLVLRNQNIRKGRLDLTSPSFTDEQGYQKRIKRDKPIPGDLVFTREAPMGEVCIIPEGLQCCLGQRMVLLRSDPQKVYGKFLLYALQSPHVQHQIGWNEGTGTTVSNIRIPNIKAFRIHHPSLEEQKRIAHILGSLDDKIELNRKMNQTLESMAQALFKSWFVDFDPVIDNALKAGNPIPEELAPKAAARKALGKNRKPLPDEVQRLFPSSFVETEAMGWVPEGWEVGIVEDLFVLQRGFDLPKSTRTDGAVPLVAASGHDGTHNEAKVSGPGVTTGRSGKLGIVTFVQNDFWPLNTTLWIKEYKKSSPYHAYFFLQTIELEVFNAGSAVPTLNRNHLHGMATMVPPKSLVDFFDRQVASLFDKKYENEKSCEYLTLLRDAVLPRLLSGDMKINNCEGLLLRPKAE